VAGSVASKPGDKCEGSGNPISLPLPLPLSHSKTVDAPARVPAVGDMRSLQRSFTAVSIAGRRQPSASAGLFTACSPSIRRARPGAGELRGTSFARNSGSRATERPDPG